MIKYLMKMFPNFPSEDNYDNWEIFNHDNYLKSIDHKYNYDIYQHYNIEFLLTYLLHL